MYTSLRWSMTTVITFDGNINSRKHKPGSGKLHRSWLVSNFSWKSQVKLKESGLRVSTDKQRAQIGTSSRFIVHSTFLWIGPVPQVAFEVCKFIALYSGVPTDSTTTRTYPHRGVSTVIYYHPVTPKLAIYLQARMTEKGKMHMFLADLETTKYKI